MNRTILTGALALLILISSLGTAHAQSGGGAGELSYQDGRGDVGPFGLPLGSGPVQGQPTPVTDSLDLVSFRLHGEDQEGFSIEIGVNNLKPVTPPIFDGGYYATYDTSFRLDGTQTTYRLRMQITGNMARTPSGEAPLPASFCVSETGRGNCNQQRVFATIDWDKSLLSAYVTKQSLMGHDPVGRGQPSANPPRLDIGSRLSDIRTTSYGGPFGGFFFSDAMPNQGGQGPYVMQSKAANDRLRLRLHSAQSQDVPQPNDFFGVAVHDFPQASVSPGSTALVQIAVQNQNAGKRLINLSAQFVDPKDASKWEVRIVPTITVPGEDQRVVNLIVNVTGKVEHRESTLVRLTARSLGFTDELGVMKLKLIAAVPPSPRAKDLYFHASGQSSSATQICFGCWGGSWLNTLETDAKATLDDGVPFTGQSGNGFNNVQYTRVFALDAPLHQDLVLNVRDPIAVVLGFRSTLPFQGTAKLELFTGDLFIGMGEAPWSGQGTASITIQPALEAERIPKGSAIVARVILVSSQPSAGMFFGLPETRPEFVPKQSKLTLPVIPDPKPPVTMAIPAGPAFLSLEVEGDAEQFVNPGKVRVFRLTLVNEGVQEDVIKITTHKDPENWYVGINPSESYRLKPGESARFGVLVKSPAGAKEGEQGRVQLNATSKADPSAIVQAQLTAIVTTGVEIEDEADNFTADEDTVAHAEEAPSRKSPSVTATIGIVAGLGVAAGLRRRRA